MAIGDAASVRVEMALTKTTKKQVQAVKVVLRELGRVRKCEGMGARLMW